MKSTVRDLVHQVRLDLRLEYRRQPAKDLGDLFKMVGGESLSELLLTCLAGTQPSALLATLSKRLGNSRTGQAVSQQSPQERGAQEKAA